MREKRNKELVCQRCGKKYVPQNKYRNSKYCSHKCLYGNQRLKSNCKVCKKSFTYLPSQRTGTYCNNSCRYLGTRKRIQRFCEQCNKDFETTPGALRNRTRYKGRFCSRICSNQWAKNNSILSIRCIKTCPVDNKIFKVVKSMAHQICCSKICGWKWSSIDPNRRDYRIEMAFRKKLRQQAKYHKRRQRIKTIKSDINTKFLLALWNKTNICVLCRKIMEKHCFYPYGRNLDHIIQLHKGGLHLQNNVRYVHAICNVRREKGKNSQKILSS
ncbi:hypothetical protein M0R04_14455 [Candidatus Dojkabacteria bacterium]|jgi:hypothetical protein|nr:hypothetical protein [Candidatus Dojkabacteria bacterium]